MPAPIGRTSKYVSHFLWEFPVTKIVSFVKLINFPSCQMIYKSSVRFYWHIYRNRLGYFIANCYVSTWFDHTPSIFSSKVLTTASKSTVSGINKGGENEWFWGVLRCWRGVFGGFYGGLCVVEWIYWGVEVNMRYMLRCEQLMAGENTGQSVGLPV